MSRTSGNNALETRLNNFFQRLQDKDLIVNSEGMRRKIKTDAGKKSIAELLGATVSRWRYNPIDWGGMVDLEDVINAAFLCNAISEGEGLITKNRKLQERSGQLEKEIEKLKRELEKKQGQLEQWEKEYGFLHGKPLRGGLEPP